MNRIAEVLEFSQSCPWRPTYPKAVVERFLRELVSTEDLIFDLHDSLGRLASAVLLDNVRNPSNDACLEVLGIRPDADSLPILGKFIDLAKGAALPYRNGFQLSMLERNQHFTEMILAKGLRATYSTYEMSRPEGVSEPLDHRGHISSAEKSDANSVYQMFRRAFSENPETSIPEAEVWIPSFLKSPQSYCFLWKENERPVGFAILVIREEGESSEVKAVGVLPEFRGQGIGRKLLRHCLNKAAGKSLKLSVAVENLKALGIYQRAGFVVAEKYQCYRTDFF